MCGIVGYIGSKNAIDVVIEGLKRLEYRGYDSAGIAYVKHSELVVKKKSGKVQRLSDELLESLNANIAIGHTRWATHGSAFWSGESGVRAIRGVGSGVWAVWSL